MGGKSEQDGESKLRAFNAKGDTEITYFFRSDVGIDVVAIRDVSFL